MTFYTEGLLHQATLFFYVLYLMHTIGRKELACHYQFFARPSHWAKIKEPCMQLF